MAQIPLKDHCSHSVTLVGIEYFLLKCALSVMLFQQLSGFIGLSQLYALHKRMNV